MTVETELAAAAILIAGKRGIIDLEGHADGRFIDGQHRQLFWRINGTNSVGDAEVFDARDGNDVAGACFFDRGAFKAAGNGLSLSLSHEFTALDASGQLDLRWAAVRWIGDNWGTRLGMLVMTPIVAGRRRKLPSLSSASTTIHSPSPSRALVP